MDSSPVQLRIQLEESRGIIARAHGSGSSGFQTCTALAEAMDQAIGFAAGNPEASTGEHTAVLALGGYGRAELSPHSDVDIMVLCDSGEHKEQAATSAKALLHLLWDAGVNIGHSVRTIEEAVDLHGRSVDAWVSMVESRFICGNTELAERFFRVIREKGITDNHWLIKGILDEQAARHKQYGNSIKLLEPNIKKSAGSLRDIHSLFWLFRGTDHDFHFRLTTSEPALKVFVDRLAAKGFIDPSEHHDILNALQFLLRSRHQMHYLRDSLHDTLEYELQLKVADALDISPERGSTAVEVFMRTYYIHARSIDRLHRRLTHRFKDAVRPSSEPLRREPLGEMFLLGGGTLSVRAGVSHLTDPHQAFQALLFLAEHDAEPDARLCALIEQSVATMNDATASDPVLAGAFRRILSSKKVASTLRLMNELNILGRFIPEFGELVAFFQHNVYHYFTADEHTLIAMAHAESLREQGGIMREVFRNLRRKELLYVAILLHDIAKPHGVADHEITGAEIARTVLHRLGMDDLIPDVMFLVRNHLVMEQVAFRRNIHDPQTIKEFAALFDRPEQLDYLFLLTYADLSAVNINVWTDWKSAILQDLYLHTLEVLRRNLSGQEVDRFHRLKRNAASAEVVDRLAAGLPRELIEYHLKSIGNDSYIALFTDEEIAGHIRSAQTGEPVTTLFRHVEGYTEVTVVGNDAPFALSHCCAVLAANDANIFDANIFTRDDGILIDRFRVSDASTRQRLEHKVCTKIADDLRNVMAGIQNVSSLFEAHKRRWKRRMERPSNPKVRIDVEFEDNPRFTIIDVYAPDAVGFLYRITESLSLLGLSIHFAKIATRVDGVVDAFYVLDKEGKPLNDPVRRDEVRQELLKTIGAVLEEKLE